MAQEQEKESPARRMRLKTWKEEPLEETQDSTPRQLVSMRSSHSLQSLLHLVWEVAAQRKVRKAVSIEAKIASKTVVQHVQVLGQEVSSRHFVLEVPRRTKLIGYVNPGVNPTFTLDQRNA